MIVKSYFAAAVIACAVLCGSEAFAITPLPPGTYDYFIEYGDPSISLFQQSQSKTYPNGGTYSLTSTSALGSTATSLTTDTTPVSLLISASATAVPLAGSGQRSFAQSETNIVFDLMAVGTPGSSVPVSVQALFNSQGQTDPNPANQLGIFGSATGYAELVISDSHSELPPNYYSWENCTFQGCTNTVNMPINTTILLAANTTYQVQESVLAIAAVLDTGTTLTSSVSADPTFSISSSYLAANPGTSLQISQGLQPLVAGVPEPQTWALMIVGFGVLGGALRRPRTRSVA